MAGFSGIKFNITTIIIVIVVLILLVGLGWYFYRQGKKKVALQALPNDLPGSTGGGEGASNDEIKRVANAIYNDLKGFNIFGHNNEPYKTAILFSNTDIVKLYNAFNTLYKPELGETLTQAVDNEKFWENDAPDTLIERLRKLNCT